MSVHLSWQLAPEDGGFPTEFVTAILLYRSIGFEDIPFAPSATPDDLRLDPRFLLETLGPGATSYDDDSATEEILAAGAAVYCLEVFFSFPGEIVRLTTSNMLFVFAHG